jgi:3-oxoacyl-[acyl-carrier protein] reductase
MDLQLTNKVALLAAATDGLGLATAQTLLKEGAKVAICGRDEKRNAAARQLLLEIAEDSHILVASCDVTDALQVNALVQKTYEKFHGIDIVITNAGGPPVGTFETLDVDSFAKGFHLNLMSAVYFLKAALPHLKKSQQPSVLTITSRSAKAPLPNLLISNVIRPAVLGLTKSLSQEWGEYGIRVNSILPGWTNTERTKHLLQKRAEKMHMAYEDCVQDVIQSLPLQRMGEPQEFANAATFLVSPAASYINGVMLLVDGGDYSGLM